MHRGHLTPEEREQKAERTLSGKRDKLKLYGNCARGEALPFLLEAPEVSDQRLHLFLFQLHRSHAAFFHFGGGLLQDGH